MFELDGQIVSVMEFQHQKIGRGSAQVRMRAVRLGLAQAPMRLGAETNLRNILTTLDAERPVLVNARMLAEIQRLTELAGASETGGGTLGRIVRLPSPLPGTSTRIVTLLTACFTDARRNVGLPGKFTFDPQALVDTAALAEQRALGESVLTVFHSHGWGSGCNRCNQNAACVLPEIDVSHEDYALLECLFPGKATLLPIAGRRLGAAGKSPVLEIHAWCGGRMGPISWRAYQD